MVKLNYNKKSALRAIDLFAGTGGMSYGFIASGIDVVAAVEIDKHAAASYKYNVGDHVFVEDIQTFGPEKLEKKLVKQGKIASKRDVNLIIGGPPCPGFSLIGRSKISNLIKSGKWEGSDSRHQFIDDKRNNLFLEFVSYVKHFKPTMFVMENVYGMTSYKSQKGESITDVIVSEFSKLGYFVTANLVDTADYGVPQHRRRMIFIGNKLTNSVPLPKKSESKINLSCVLQDLPVINPLTGKSTKNKLKKLKNKQGSDCLNLMQWLRSAKSNGNEACKNGTISQNITRKVNPRDQAIFPLLLSGENGKRRLYRDIFPNMIKSVEANLTKDYMISPESEGFVVKSKINGDNRSWKWYNPTKFGDKMRRLRGDKPSNTIVAHLCKDGYMFVHPYEDRTITIREAARIQTFPDSFDFSANGTIPFSHQMRVIGNAVPPVFAMKLAESIIKHITEISDL